MSYILIVDDDKVTRELIKTMLPEYMTTEAMDGDCAIDALGTHEPIVVLLDLCMPGRDGFDVLRYLKESPIQPHVIVITAVDDEQTIKTALNSADDILLKPIQPAVLRAKISKAINERKYRELIIVLDEIAALFAKVQNITQGEVVSIGGS